MLIDLAKIDFAPGQGGGGGKIETSWSVSTVTENGTYTYSASAIGPNYTLSDVTVPVDVHPSDSLSETYTTNGTFSIEGEFNGGEVTVDVQGGPKPEESLVETITSNGTYSYSPQAGYVYDGAEVTVSVPGQKPENTLVRNITNNDYYTFTPVPGTVYDGAQIYVDVHPSTSLSETYTSNGTYNISGEFNGGTIVVSVSGGGGGSTDQYIYRNGSVDETGLTEIGWSQDDINYYKYNSPHYSWRNSEYTVSQGDKNLYGVIDDSNKDSYKYIVQYLPVYDTSNVANFMRYFKEFYHLRAIPSIDLSSYTGSCRYMFEKCYELETIPPLDFSGCTSIANLFQDCYSLVSVPSPLVCTRLTTLASMFTNCRSLAEVPQLVTGTLQYADNFCQGCSSLKYVPELNIINVRRTRYMFDGCSSLEDFSFPTQYYEVEPGVEVLAYIMSSDTDLTAMFRDCKILEFEHRPGFYVSTSATKFSFMFEGCEMMLHSPYMNYIGGEVMQMFMGCKVLQYFDNVDTLGDFTDCRQMFAACEGLLHINKSLPTSNCTSAQMSEMFRRCYRLENIAGIDFSSCDGDPDLFGDDTGDLNYLTSVTVNGSINVSFPSTFSRCITLDRSSVLSILTAMSNANNADPKDMVFSVSVEDGQDLQDLLTACTAKGWNITGLTVVPVV